MSALPSLLLDAAVAWLRPRVQQPLIGLVLGSGLGHLADQLEQSVRIPYGQIPNMPTPTVVGHGGELIVGQLGGSWIACLSGRVHLYEGHAPERVVFGVRLLALLGARAVLLTNAAGGIAASCAPGSLMVIDDHLNLTGTTPLLGLNDAALGPRFPDMSQAYDPTLSDLLQLLGPASGLGLSRGVYAGLLGPSYETPAEIRMLETMGASAVGMSTVLEVLALRHMGVRVAGLSCITNWAAGKSREKLAHEEVAAVAERVRFQFGSLVATFCARAPALLAVAEPTVGAS